MMEMLLLVVWPTKHQILIQYGLTDENSAFPDNEAWHGLPACSQTPEQCTYFIIIYCQTVVNESSL